MSGPGWEAHLGVCVVSSTHSSRRTNRHVVPHWAGCSWSAFVAWQEGCCCQLLLPLLGLHPRWNNCPHCPASFQWPKYVCGYKSCSTVYGSRRTGCCSALAPFNCKKSSNGVPPSAGNIVQTSPAPITEDSKLSSVCQYAVTKAFIPRQGHGCRWRIRHWWTPGHYDKGCAQFKFSIWVFVLIWAVHRRPANLTQGQCWWSFSKVGHAHCNTQTTSEYNKATTPAQLWIFRMYSQPNKTETSSKLWSTARPLYVCARWIFRIYHWSTLSQTKLNEVLWFPMWLVIQSWKTLQLSQSWSSCSGRSGSCWTNILPQKDLKKDWSQPTSENENQQDLVKMSGWPNFRPLSILFPGPMLKRATTRNI